MAHRRPPKVQVFRDGALHRRSRRSEQTQARKKPRRKPRSPPAPCRVSRRVRSPPRNVQKAKTPVHEPSRRDLVQPNNSLLRGPLMVHMRLAFEATRPSPSHWRSHDVHPAYQSGTGTFTFTTFASLICFIDTFALHLRIRLLPSRSSSRLHVVFERTQHKAI